MRHLLANLAGCWELMLLAIRSRCRLRGAYWRWRHETAFGTDPAHQPSRWAQLRQVLAYGRWVHEMKRGGSP